MPHAGLMGGLDRDPVAGPLLRARLHLRGARRRLGQGKIAAGIVTLYDALDAALEFWLAARSGAAMPLARPEELQTTRGRYRALVAAGVLDGTFDFDAFDALVDAALREEPPSAEYGWAPAGLDGVMTQLGVVPFEESSLPPEDPRTF